MLLHRFMLALMTAGVVTILVGNKRGIINSVFTDRDGTTAQPRSQHGGENQIQAYDDLHHDSIIVDAKYRTMSVLLYDSEAFLMLLRGEEIVAYSGSGCDRD